MSVNNQPFRSPWFRFLTIAASGFGGMMIGVWAMSVALPHNIAGASGQTVGAIIAALCTLAASGGAHAYFIGQDETKNYLRREIETDKLTGFHSRIAMIPVLAQLSLAANRKGKAISIINIEIDRFKQINESIGRERADALIYSLAARLAGSMGDAELGRVGAGEFLVGLRETPGTDSLSTRIDELLAHLQEPYIHNNQQHRVTISAGVVINVDPKMDPLSVIRNASLALQQARSTGHGRWAFYNREMGRFAEYRQWLEVEMQPALERDEFQLHYQPQISMQDGKTVGYEALIRWIHPTRGSIPPIDFIPVAEETGFIVKLGEWVLRRACEEARLIPDSQYVAVNLSAIQFMMADLVPMVQRIVRETGIKPSKLELEITESVMVSDKARTVATLNQLAEMGISVAVDDFGTGYSSLGYLADFTFSKLKIDRSFVRRLSSETSSSAIVSSIVGLSRALGIKTVAEGVETEDQALMLRAAGCNVVQGYLYGKPAPLREQTKDQSGTLKLVSTS
jgi:diguanylate cyclase (GGDEF)-like protein